MNVLVMADMEGIAWITSTDECWPVYPEYWSTGRQKMTNDIAAASLGLLDSGADHVYVMDGHGSGGWRNVLPEELPRSVTLIEHLDLEQIDATFQVGYHARCGTTDGFISHTNVPEFRIQVNGRLITESHEDALVTGVPLLGIAGDTALEPQIDGALNGTPFCPVKSSTSRTQTMPVHRDPRATAIAIREFARECMRDYRSRPALTHPTEFDVRVSMNAELTRYAVEDQRLTRVSDRVLSLHGSDWNRDIRPGLNTARLAALRPFLDAQGDLDLSDPTINSLNDDRRIRQLRAYISDWMNTDYTEWYD